MILLQINEAVMLVLLVSDDAKSVFDGDKNVILESLSIASTSLRIFLDFSQKLLVPVTICKLSKNLTLQTREWSL